MTTDPNSPSDPSQASPYTPPPSAPPPMGAGDPLTGPAPAANYPPPEAPPATAPPASYAPPPEAPAAATGAAATSVSFNRAKVSTADLTFAGAAVLFLIAMILPWASLDLGAGFGSVTVSGFDIGRLTFALILLIAAAALALLPAFGMNLALPVPRAVILLALTGLAVIVTFTAFIDVATSDGIGTGFGAWLGMLVTLGAVVQAALMFRADKAGAPAA